MCAFTHVECFTPLQGVLPTIVCASNRDHFWTNFVEICDARKQSAQIYVKLNCLSAHLQGFKSGHGWANLLSPKKMTSVTPECTELTERMPYFFI